MPHCFASKFLVSPASTLTLFIPCSDVDLTLYVSRGVRRERSPAGGGEGAQGYGRREKKQQDVSFPHEQTSVCTLVATLARQRLRWIARQKFFEQVRNSSDNAETKSHWNRRWLRSYVHTRHIVSRRGLYMYLTNYGLHERYWSYNSECDKTALRCATKITRVTGL